jgi:hypothetical protein
MSTASDAEEGNAYDDEPEQLFFGETEVTWSADGTSHPQQFQFAMYWIISYKHDPQYWCRVRSIL